jgi:hypothetical protein
MRIPKSKTKISAITFVLVLTISAMLVALPIVGAHDPPWTVPTWAYLYATPNPVGVTQQVLLIFWLDAVPPTALGAYGDRWTGFTIEITKPDGTSETMGPYKSDPIGGGYAIYTPSQVGSYTFVLNFPGNVITGLPTGTGVPMNNPAVNDTYAASTSEEFTLTVQEDPIEAWQETTLPTEYWTRPINGINRNWWQIAGNWLNAGDTGPGAPGTGSSTKLNPYSEGPESAHIMWAREYWAGGIMGGQTGDIGYYTGQSYEVYWTTPIILNGKFYYNVETPPRYGWYCVDLYTGETDYFQNTSGPVVISLFQGHPGMNPSGGINQQRLAFGQVYNYDSPNQHGGFPYLWSTDGPTPNTWMMFDAYSGNYICSIANVSSSGTAVYGKEGSILRYNIVNLGNNTNPNYYLQVWNTSRAIWWNPLFDDPNYDPAAVFSSFYYWNWRPYLNNTYDGRKGFSLNVSIPTMQGTIRAVREGQYVIGGTQGSNNDQGIVQGNLWALSLKPGEEGKLLWNKTFTPPESVVPAIKSGGFFSPAVGMAGVYPEEGVFTFKEPITRQRWGYSLDTMQYLWGPTEPEPQGAYYGMTENVYKGMLLGGGVAAGLGNVYGYTGHIIAYNITTGEVLWDYVSGSPGLEAPYENAPVAIGCMADGKLYLFSTEHSPTQPLWRGSYLRCVNASNGVELWRINHWGNNPAISEGYVIDLNLYDNRIYCYGKGPSATTVTAPENCVPLGEKVLIKGTVTDECAGAKKLVEEGKFSIVPAISDEDQQAWMEYLYQQQAKPKDATGVEVVLTTLDPNGNAYELGRTTSSESGVFGCEIDPPVPGLYKIAATFEGSAAYYGSYAETYISVGEAPSPAQPIEPEAPTQPEPTEPAPIEPEPTEPEPEAPTEPEEPEAPTEPEPTEPAEAPFITTEIAIIIAVAVVAVISVVAFWILRKRK